MIASVTILATLASAAIAAPTYYNTYDSDKSFQTCQNYVEKPAWGGDGKPYGYENGRSCIAKDGNYGTGSYAQDSYSKPSYETYSKPSYDSYSKPSYSLPSYDSHVTPSYDTSSSDSYSKPTYSKYGSLVAAGYQAPSSGYSAPSEGYSAPPANYGYQAPSSGYSAPTYGSSYTCDSEFPYFHSTGSPTLIQCAKIACVGGQSPEYVQRALYQCHALETQAKAANGGYLPSSW
ncbi:hypothetical protein BDK51DRAFT_40081 [Blyttiomyces helicus]|uniref:Uncharacterized protein n=1 Tax=Blyttiomyces helicus TaxID=388810 RepID=A0A4P9W9B1_9FUNG|nr:hypothetical protein BDK51DRAFT_40081 [Blyttiomyces helicus]|eukprot:RKO89141.1 hypothetical protein BDK51DRAFT_40081 [Blyttiomyces helicus]